MKYTLPPYSYSSEITTIDILIQSPPDGWMDKSYFDIKYFRDECNEYPRTHHPS